MKENFSPLLLPVVALAAWTMVVCTWMLSTRVTAILKSKMKMNRFAPRGEQMALLPANVRWKADNYNNLMEQPTVFYAVMMVLILSANADQTNPLLAWTYVILRIGHSLCQVLINLVPLRFLLFAISSACLAGLVINAIRGLI